MENTTGQGLPRIDSEVTIFKGYQMNKYYCYHWHLGKYCLSIAICPTWKWAVCKYTDGFQMTYAVDCGRISFMLSHWLD